MTNPNRIFDFTAGAKSNAEPPPQQQAVLLTPQRRPWWQLPFAFMWTAWEHFAYFFAPASGCQFCWVLRMFLLGMLVGGYLVHAFPWIRLW